MTFVGPQETGSTDNQTLPHLPRLKDKKLALSSWKPQQDWAPKNINQVRLSLAEEKVKIDREAPRQSWLPSLDQGALGPQTSGFNLDLISEPPKNESLDLGTK